MLMNSKQMMFVIYNLIPSYITKKITPGHIADRTLHINNQYTSLKKKKKKFSFLIQNAHRSQ